MSGGEGALEGQLQVRSVTVYTAAGTSQTVGAGCFYRFRGVSNPQPDLNVSLREVT